MVTRRVEIMAYREAGRLALLDRVAWAADHALRVLRGTLDKSELRQLPVDERT